MSGRVHDLEIHLRKFFAELLECSETGETVFVKQFNIQLVPDPSVFDKLRRIHPCSGKDKPVGFIVSETRIPDPYYLEESYYFLDIRDEETIPAVKDPDIPASDTAFGGNHGSFRLLFGEC